MKKLTLIFAAFVVCLSAQAQSPIKKIVERFDDPEKGHTVFIEKGSRSVGISGSYRNFRAGGYVSSDGFDVLSLLNMGSGEAHIWTVAPKFNWFLANDFALGVVWTTAVIGLTPIFAWICAKGWGSSLRRPIRWIPTRRKARRPWLRST